VCLQQDFPELPVTDDIGDALKLRLTAHTLDMEAFTGHFDACYADALEDRVPTLREIDVVLENTGKKEDGILVALANRLSYLCRYHKVEEEEKAFAKILAQKKYATLLAAVDDTEVEAMAERAVESI
jgi:hypothetical protein